MGNAVGVSVGKGVAVGGTGVKVGSSVGVAVGAGGVGTPHAAAANATISKITAN